jgi:hypothetical protein
LSFFAHGPWHPVLTTQHLQDRASDERDGVGLKLDLAASIELVDSLHESDRSCADEVFPIQTVRECAHHAACGDLHQMGEVLDDLAPCVFAAISLELSPEPV